ncbi:MAG: hypothetical protein AMXMBFR47_29460 [Planctomycetota bacterium]
MSKDADVHRLEAKLDVLIRLIALSVTSEDEPLKDRAVRLQRAGLAPKDIAALFGTTSNTVSVALSTAKRASKGRGGGK